MKMQHQINASILDHKVEVSNVTNVFIENFSEFNLVNLRVFG